MKTRIAIFAAGIMLLGSTAWAQTSGTVTLNGEVLPTVSLTFHSAALVDTTTSTPGQATGDALAYVIEMGDVGDLTRPAYVGGTVNVELRANNAGGLVTIAASVVGTNLPGGAGVLGLEDIGFGVGAQADFTVGTLAGPGATSAAPLGNFGTNPLTAGLPYAATLADLPGPIVEGTGRVSNSGGLTDDNALRIPLHFAVQPAMYTPVANWSAVVTFTATAL